MFNRPSTHENPDSPSCSANRLHEIFLDDAKHCYITNRRWFYIQVLNRRNIARIAIDATLPKADPWLI